MLGDPQPRRPNSDAPPSNARFADALPPTQNSPEIKTDKYRDSTLSVLQHAWQSSTTWLNTNYSRQWQRNIANFQSRHPAGSKYHTARFNKRSRAFRPKTRSASRQAESGFTVAMFSHPDHMQFEAALNSEEQHIAAKLIKELLQIHLNDRKSINWFMTAICGYQTARTMGAVVSHQGWELEERIQRDELQDTFTQDGEQAYEERAVAIKDRPFSNLVQLEFFRFDSGARWDDPIGTSPYTIEKIPMYVGDVIERMDNDQSGIPWISLSREQLAAAAWHQDEASATSWEREKLTEDRFARRKSVRDHDTIGVHRNIIREKGEDMLVYTAGNHHLMSQPVPLREIVEWVDEGERDYTMGYANLEAFRLIPPGVIELSESLQATINETTNLRIDNVNLSLAKRFITKRHMNIDKIAMERAIPGGAIDADDVDAIKPLDVPEVTGSAYAEQDRLNAEMDQLLGTVDSSSIEGSRNMGGTATGMAMLESTANRVSEYELRVIGETWIKPTLDQLRRLIQRYESSNRLIGMAAKTAKLQEEGVQVIDESIMRADIIMNINIGYGATDPMGRVNNIFQGINGLQLVPGALEMLDPDEITEEVFARIGFPYPDRFIKDQEKVDPAQVAQMQQQIEEMQQMLQTEENAYKRAVDVAQIGAQTQEKKLDRDTEIAMLKDEIERYKLLLEDEKAEDSRRSQQLTENLALHQIEDADAQREHELKMKDKDLAAKKADAAAKVMPGKAGTVARDNYGKLRGGPG